ncbi:MAG TPA: LytTR family DNA-binding domain-containing protein [Chitinophagaceae bacterium]|nr:LytTR family DNA-binding domain-containing protein [Chitinophagaceae bacterium]
MVHAIIIEDERLAQQDLIRNLNETWPDIHIEATLSSVRESIEYLVSSPRADIIFSDVQLPDGLSFELFNHVNLDVPVIFITGYDEFMLNAFEYNGIDYLLKPVSRNDLEKAMLKYKMLERHFAADNLPVKNLIREINSRRRSRLLVRKGLENLSLKLSEVILFYTENKVVYVVDQSGRKYLADRNLSDLEEELDPAVFFRANRQYIVNINFVKGFKAYEKVKLLIDLTVPDLNHAIIVSQETAPAFRKWMYDA